MSLSILRASLLVVVCVTAWAHAATPQTRQRSYRRDPPRVYQVRDERKRIGYIDGTGRLVIGFDRLPAFALIGEFSEGLAPGCVADAKTGYCAENGYGYFDGTGRLIPPRFMNAGGFSGGLAFVYVSREEGGGFINRRGELVFRVKEGSTPSPFQEGLSAVMTGAGVEFIDPSGRVVIAGPYAFAEPFSEGLAAVAEGRGRGAKYGFINREGKMVIRPRFEPECEHHGFIIGLSSFIKGLACVKVGTLYGFIDKRGEMVVAAEFNYPSAFSEGFACVSRRGGEAWEFTDKRGRRAFGRSFAYCGSFSGGLAPVEVKTPDGERWGYIDRRGRFAIKPRFARAHSFDGDLADVSVVAGPETDPAGNSTNTFRAYIDKKGRYVWRQR
jgi:hypothetical protein